MKRYAIQWKALGPDAQTRRPGGAEPGRVYPAAGHHRPPLFSGSWWRTGEPAGAGPSLVAIDKPDVRMDFERAGVGWLWSGLITPSPLRPKSNAAISRFVLGPSSLVPDCGRGLCRLPHPAIWSGTACHVIRKIPRIAWTVCGPTSTAFPNTNAPSKSGNESLDGLAYGKE